MGDRAGAVSTYHHCASVLERELGVTPDPATRQTLERVMARVDTAGARLPTIGPAAGRSGIAAAGLVGRSAELALLQDLWRTAAAGCPSLVLVEGGAGVGKTRLVAEVAEMARLQGAVVASTQCFGTWGRVALAPVADWLRNPAVQSAATTLDPAWRAEVDRLVPSGKSREKTGGGSRVVVDAWQRHRFFEGLARALIGVGRPMLLVLDNMQWCDQETLAPGTGPRRSGPGGRDPAQRQPRRRPRTRGLDRPDAGHRPAHRAFPQPAGGRRHGQPRRGDLREAPPRGRREPAPGDDGRFPVVRHRGRTQQRRSWRPAAGR